MAKLTGPLLSFGAKGQLGKAMVTASWKGIPYARQYVVPANPRTTAQQAVRTTFALLREMYKLAPAALRAPWEAFVTGRPFVPVNKFVGENLRLVNGKTDMTDFEGSPGARGGLPPAAIAAAPTANPGEIAVTVTVPDQLPDGWTINSAVACGFPDQDPSGIFTGPLVTNVDLNDPYVPTLTGLPTATLCVVSAWLVYNKPDGSLAYSVSLTDTATPA